MKSNSVITRIAEGIHAEAMQGLQALSDVKAAQVKAITEAGVDEGLEMISSLVSAIEAVIKAPRVEGVGLPAFLSKVTVAGDVLNEVTVSVRTKLKADYKYRKDVVVAVDENLVMNIASVYIDALFDMFYIEMAMENAAELNARIATIIEENGIGYGFEFVVNADTDALVLAIDNNKVVFNANITRAHDISNLGIFQGGDEYADLVCREATDSLVSALKAVQTPVQLIKANIGLIKDVTGVSTKKRASKLIRDSYHRQAKYLNGVKEGIGYFNDTVKVGGEEVEVFALVSKDLEGNLEVVLNPFDVKTLYTVEFDVLKAVKKQMA